MEPNLFTPSDIRQIEQHGLTVRQVLRQMDLFRAPQPYLNLKEPCTRGNGITVLTAESAESFARLYERERVHLDCIKFIPASGAATRMFRVPLKFMNREKALSRESLSKEMQLGNPEAQAIKHFFDRLPDFAFVHDLETGLRSSGRSLQELIDNGAFHEILKFLLTDKGLHYSALPKALLKFHAYKGESRTAFEEHLVEAAAYAVNGDGVCSVHFTVSGEHLQKFQSLLERLQSSYARAYGVSYRVGFSTQKPSTDTIAVDLNNRPFRQKDGRLLFRPGGHGALIENLNELQNDLIFIKNIDNVVPDWLKKETFYWKRVLGGLLIHIQRRVFKYMDALSQNTSDRSILEEATDFAVGELSLILPPSFRSQPLSNRREYLLKKLNRPIRVCGMVKNAGEPGGGPFWVTDKNGECSCKIVETAQVDPHSKEQKRIVAASTHFNPVDLVCAVKNWRGEAFELRLFVDPEAVLIARKSKYGRELKALELPGLWNGAMAHWNSVFVEVPSTTFHPVKTINDLLRKEHQPLINDPRENVIGP